MSLRLGTSHSLIGQLWALGIFGWTSSSAAAPDALATLPRPPPASDHAQGTDYRPSFWLSDPRFEASAGELDLMRFEVHGEYQIRGEGLSQLRLSDYDQAGFRNRLGQTHRLWHYFRWTPVLTYRTNLRFIAQLDVPTGLALGQQTKEVNADYDSLSNRQPMALSPRWLYAEIAANYGIFASVNNRPPGEVDCCSIRETSVCPLEMHAMVLLWNASVGKDDHSEAALILSYW